MSKGRAERGPVEWLPSLHCRRPADAPHLSGPMETVGQRDRPDSLIDIMVSVEGKPAGRAARIIDALLTLAVFMFFTWVLRSHVPSSDPFFIWLWAGVSASCLTALFWLALQMFRVVLQNQRKG
jgi:hypothetical protein